MTPDDAREQLLRALLVERFTRHQSTPPAAERTDDLTGRRRLNQAAEELHPTERQSA